LRASAIFLLSANTQRSFFLLMPFRASENYPNIHQKGADAPAAPRLLCTGATGAPDDRTRNTLFTAPSKRATVRFRSGAIVPGTEVRRLMSDFRLRNTAGTVIPGRTIAAHRAGLNALDSATDATPSAWPPKRVRDEF
jgi:hypothetical protein